MNDNFNWEKFKEAEYKHQEFWMKINSKKKRDEKEITQETKKEMDEDGNKTCL
jgi:hypothetical protein